MLLLWAFMLHITQISNLLGRFNALVYREKKYKNINLRLLLT